MATLEYKPLSPRELEVLYWTSQGYIDKEIAKELGIAVNTVKNYGIKIRRKLNARTRTDAVTRAVQYGIIRAVIENEGYLNGF